MLNADTKRRINACRDILVGKIPNPQAQVEQITLALMYKFMNDLDHEVVDLGGHASFFAGEFAAYSWDRITDQRIGGDERLRLYAEGIEKVVTNPAVPELFRQIFRNAYLPYRDPETFHLFAREISAFTYDHSEDLGDAFEYLLSIMQSQGDAGQFRTPRHLIDFMVEVVKPAPGEVVLDPACGTAGFLIAAYKYVRRTQPDLTPAQIEELHHNVEGYDISPDMVRLSRVNLYLHRFADPRVTEYDTLTSVDRWGHRADVILANPPFMTPKGGIRPHRKFRLESNRSEVLFVDYIAEHLMAGGRAAVIVPEGVIFQSGKAYKALRRLLVESHLWAVASLPAGVFNPYSGVKTSILFFDRPLAEKKGPVLFLTVAADGYDLGAQRRPVAANDLPAALALLTDAHGRLTRGEVPADLRDSLPGVDLKHLFVPRAALLAEADVNLSGERYRVAAATGPQKWPRVKLGEVCEFVNGRAYKQEELLKAGKYPVLRVGNFFSKSEFYYSDLELEQEKYCNDGDLLYAWSASFGPRIWRGGRTIFHYHIWKVVPSEVISRDYLFLALDRQTEQFKRDGGRGIAMMHITKGGIEQQEIPLPPLSVQQEIVAEVGRYQAVIDGARQVVEHWKPSFAVDPLWPVVKLGEVLLGKPRNGYSGQPVEKETNVKVLSLSATSSGYLDPTKTKYLDESFPPDFHAWCRPGDIYLQRGNTRELVGMPAVFGLHQSGFVYPDLMIRLQADPRKVLTDFLHLYLLSPPGREYMTSCAAGAAGSMPKINQSIVESMPLPLPPLEIQQAIVDRIEAERALVEANKKLIELMKGRIDEVMARVWA
jgi:type I restriction enzyme M protein